MKRLHTHCLALALIASSVSGACADDRWYEGRWAVQGTDCESKTPAGISIFGDKVVFYRPSGGMFSMDAAGGKTEADYAKLTEQSATITSRIWSEVGYSFLATIDHDGAEAGFGMVAESGFGMNNEPLEPITLVVQTGFYWVVRCDGKQ